MRGYRSFRQFRHPGRATLDKAIDSEAGERRSEPADKDGVVDRATEDLVCQSSFGFRPQWALPRLAALPVQGGKIVTAIAAPDLQIAYLQLRGLGDTRPGVVEKEQKRVFAATAFGFAVGHGEHGLHFRPGQPSD